MIGAQNHIGFSFREARIDLAGNSTLIDISRMWYHAPRDRHLFRPWHHIFQLMLQLRCIAWIELTCNSRKAHESKLHLEVRDSVFEAIFFAALAQDLTGQEPIDKRESLSALIVGGYHQVNIGGHIVGIA